MLLPHDEPHLRRVAPAAGSAHTLQESGDCERCVDLKRPFQPPDVDAELQRRGGTDRQERVVVLHFLFGTFPVGGREVPVVNQEAFRLVVCFTVLTQALADRFTLFPGIGEDQALFSACMLKDISDAGIRSLRCGVGRLLRRR